MWAFLTNNNFFYLFIFILELCILKLWKSHAIKIVCCVYWHAVCHDIDSFIGIRWYVYKHLTSSMNTHSTKMVCCVFRGCWLALFTVLKHPWYEYGTWLCVNNWEKWNIDETFRNNFWFASFLTSWMLLCGAFTLFWKSKTIQLSVIFWSGRQSKIENTLNAMQC